MMRAIGQWLKSRGMEVYCELQVHHDFKEVFKPFPDAMDGVDLCITLGGDGTVMYLAGMFPDTGPLPPVVSFSMGTLGFLTPFDVHNYKRCLNQIMGAGRDDQTPLYCTLRSRKACEVYAGGALQRVHHVLNECAVDRGPHPSTLNLEVFVDGEFVTTVQADGLIVATPTGSTAYSMSAGGPMVAPSVPSTLLTPIAPLSLSFRPLVIPESSEVIVHLPCDARTNARVSFDGRFTTRLQRGGYIRMATSAYPLPLLNMYRLDRDWYQGITQKLGWNKSIKRRDAPGVQHMSYEQVVASACPIGEAAATIDLQWVEDSRESEESDLPVG